MWGSSHETVTAGNMCWVFILGLHQWWPLHTPWNRHSPVSNSLGAFRCTFPTLVVKALPGLIPSASTLPLVSGLHLQWPYFCSSNMSSCFLPQALSTSCSACQGHSSSFSHGWLHCDIQIWERPPPTCRCYPVTLYHLTLLNLLQSTYFCPVLYSRTCLLSKELH